MPAIDTDVVVRYLTGDDAAPARAACKLATAARKAGAGKVRVL